MTIIKHITFQKKIVKNQQFIEKSFENIQNEKVTGSFRMKFIKNLKKKY